MTVHFQTQDQVRVMIVEDSLTARTMLKHMVETAPDLRVIDMAKDPFDAAEKMRKVWPEGKECMLPLSAKKEKPYSPWAKSISGR